MNLNISAGQQHVAVRHALEKISNFATFWRGASRAEAVQPLSFLYTGDYLHPNSYRNHLSCNWYHWALWQSGNALYSTNVRKSNTVNSFDRSPRKLWTIW
jgi:hypothetical protein